MSDTVVITGGSGFIGSAFAAESARRGATVRVLVRETSDLWRLDGVDATHHVGDVRDPASLQGLFEGATWVVHAAGKLGAAGVPESAYTAVHEAGTRHVMEAVAAQAPRARVLHISTPGILGPVTLPPGADRSDPSLFPAEDAPIRPTNPYERTKARGEAIALSFAERGLDVRVMRPEFVYGPGDLHVLGVFRAIQRGFFFYIGDGTNTCHPTYIADVVTGMTQILAGGRRGEVYHITGPGPITWRVFGTAVADALGVAPPRLRLPRALLLPAAQAAEFILTPFGRKPPLSVTGVNFFSENRGTTFDKARQAIGYTPRIDIGAGARGAVMWYRARGLLT